MANTHPRPPDDDYEARRQQHLPARPQTEQAPHMRRDSLLPGRVRPRRGQSQVSEEMTGAQNPTFRMSLVAWGILLVGMALAVFGVIQSTMLSKNPVHTADEQTLVDQIGQLKAQLDKERAENTDLTAKLTTPTSGPSDDTSVDQPDSGIQASEAEQSSDPQAQTEAGTSFDVQDQPSPQTSTGEAEVPLPATSDDSSLPPPMAPSAELLNQKIPEPPASAQKASAYGIHLASFADRTMAERGWLLLVRNHPGAFGDLKPRIDEVKDENGHPVFLLIAGPFDTEVAATDRCKRITTQVVFCRARPFNGSEFAAASH